ncbi:MAG: ABC transporter permease [Acutalibacteraceae bacterium]
MKLIISRIKQSPLLSGLLIFGLVTSILLISVGTSFVANLFYGHKAKDDAAPPNGELYSISFSDLKDSDNLPINQLFSQIDEKTGLFVNYLMFHIDGTEVNSYRKASGEYFLDENVWHFPIVKGDYYTADDVKNGNKVVLIGSSLEKYTYEKNDKEYIKIEGDEYCVVGIIGFENQASPWDGRIVMPYTALPQSYFDVTLKKQHETISFIIYNEDGDYSGAEDYITNQGEKIFSDFNLEDVGPIVSDNVLKLVATNPDNLIIVALVGYIITVIYAINITVFWMEKRKYEISVRKAFGFTNGSIMKMIFSEMTGFAFIAFVFAVLLQLVLNFIIGSMVDYTLKIYLSNLAVGLIVVFITAIVTSIVPVIKAIKVQPAEALKRKKG